MPRCSHSAVAVPRGWTAALLLCFVASTTACAQRGSAWLRYAIPPDPPRYHGLPHTVVLLGDAAGNIAPEEQTAADELDRGLGHMVAGTDVVLHRFDLSQDAIILGTTDALHRARLGRHLRGWTEKPLPEEGFRIVHLRRGIREWYVLQGGSPRAVLWAAFRFAALVAEDQQLPESYTDAPQFSRRLVDLRGTDDVLPLLNGTQSGTGLLRLLASVGINGLIVETRAAEVAAAAQPYGMRVLVQGQDPIRVSEAMPADQPLSGLASPSFSKFAGTPQLAAFALLDTRLPGLAYPAPAWAGALQTPERSPHGDTTLAALLSEPGSGAVGSLTTAQAAHLLAEPLLQANLYAFGRLLWSPSKPVADITDEWSRQTWGDDARVHAAATRILLESTAAARDNTSPLGLPLLATSTGAPTPQRAAEVQVAGEPLASNKSIGIKANSADIDLYPNTFATQLADPARCPPQLLLMFHRLPYTYAMPDGKMLVQAIYNAHFSGAAQADNALDLWQTTQGLVDAPRFAAVQTFLARGAVHAQLWREYTTEWLQATSGIPDALGFVGSHPGRIAAAAMQRSGYTLNDSNSFPLRGQLLCHAASCTASTRFQGAGNVYRVEIGYADAHRGTGWQLLVNGVEQARWQDSTTRAEAAGSSPSPAEDERFVVNGVHLSTGDTVEVRAEPKGTDGAPLYFLEITRDPRWN